MHDKLWMVQTDGPCSGQTMITKRNIILLNCGQLIVWDSLLSIWVVKIVVIHVFHVSSANNVTSSREFLLSFVLSNKIPAFASIYSDWTHDSFERHWRHTCFRKTFVLRWTFIFWSKYYQELHCLSLKQEITKVVWNNTIYIYTNECEENSVLGKAEKSLDSFIINLKL